MDTNTLMYVVGAVAVGTLAGYYLRRLVLQGKQNSLELEIKKKELEQKERAREILERAEEKAERLREKAEQEARDREEKIAEREERLLRREESIDKKQTQIESEEDKLRAKQEEIIAEKDKVHELRQKEEAKLTEIAGLSPEIAKAELLKKVQEESEEDLLVRMRKLEASGKDRLERKAKEILTTCIHRFGNSVAPDVMTTLVSLPSEDVKGKIIGREGRNIRAFEQAAGVELVVDGTPNAIVISSFDPIRRQVARLALENLILDGRIQPVKIEEMIQKAKDEINDIIKGKGEKAAQEVGIYTLDSNTISILGRLYFRTSYGQNVLQHSIEVALIAGMLAREIGADEMVAKTAGLVHDIGKAVDHEISGNHVEIGRRILQKFGASEAVIKAMQAHHEEYPYETLESMIVQVADHISGARPGARSDTVENYLERLTDLENLAGGFTGVEKCYALQAGREIRIFVTADEVSDLEAVQLARQVATKIESDLRYPGEIRVNVIRETRVITYAR